MKAKVIIEQGITKVVLTCENEFEKDIVEKIKDYRSDYEIETTVSTNYQFQTHNEHKIEMIINEL
jgi:CO dehydrogenase/acetyl-CoA synthase alpha subunit